MTPLDFFTDHLVNIDGLFDKHDNGDEQKPHIPIQSHHQGQTQITFITCFAFSNATFFPVLVKPTMPTVNFIQSEFISKIFHPPIV